MGERIKEAARSKGIPIKRLAESVGVSRQAVNDWIKGQIPKGDHLISLCRQLDVDPGYLFTPDILQAVTVPLHRKRGAAKITGAVKDEAFELAQQYEILFRGAPSPGVVPILRIDQRNEETARKTADMLRKMSGIEKDRPIDWAHTFSLLEQLGIVTIFRAFPKKIKSYAFHTRIYRHRVIFVNIETNITDLIFPLLHDAVHCLRDEKNFNGEHDEVEEYFCDQVANHIQFPDEYVSSIYTAISGLSPGVQINKLKEFSKRIPHSLYGINKAILFHYPRYSLDSAAANANYKKEFPTIGDIIFKTDDPRDYVEKLIELSPRFIEILVEQLDGISDRKLGELLGLDSGLDAKSVKAELLRLH